MKKRFNLIILCVAIATLFATATPSRAATSWFPANQKTVAWDAPTKLADGSLVPAGDMVKYQVWSKRGTDAPVKIQAEDTKTQMTLSFSNEGRYLIGVQAIRYPAGETVGLPSAITWSDSADVVSVPEPFGLVYYVAPQDPKGLRPQP